MELRAPLDAGAGLGGGELGDGAARVVGRRSVGQGRRAEQEPEHWAFGLALWGASALQGGFAGRQAGAPSATESITREQLRASLRGVEQGCFARAADGLREWACAVSQTC